MLATGFLLNQKQDPLNFAILIWANITGVFLVYRLNDCVDQREDLKFNLKHFFSYKLHLVAVGQLTLITIPLAFYFLSEFSLLILSISAVLGMLYSLSFGRGEKQFRIKNLFFIKNLMIGSVWGALVLIGAGEYNDQILAFFIFSSAQVFVGSMVRDVPDLDKDSAAGVKSFPVIIGVGSTFVVMHAVNLTSIGAAAFSNWNENVLIVMFVSTIWRMVGLYFLTKNHNSRFWSQTANLLTCVLIPIILMITLLYANS